MKTCTKCKESKRINRFYPHKGYKDGFNSRCKECLIKYQVKHTEKNRSEVNKKRRVREKIYRDSRSDRQRSIDNEKASGRRLKRIGPRTIKPRMTDARKKELNNERSKNYYLNNIAKARASRRVCHELDSGRMKRGPCEKCGSLKFVDGHHDDYSKPLKVRWLCRRHHQKWHRLNGPGING